MARTAKRKGVQEEQPLSPEEIRSCKTSLLGERDRLIEFLEQEGVRHEEAGFNEASLRVHERVSSKEKLVEVDEALARIEARRFGNCLDCGQPINRDRISAYPHVSRCRDCEARRGKKIW